MDYLVCNIPDRLIALTNKKPKMTNSHTPYSGRMKAADLIAADRHLLSIFERFNIKLGFGEATVAELCERYSLSTELFLIICSICSFGNYRPKADALKKEDLHHIISYLRASHRYYIGNCFPALHNDIHTMMDEYDETSRNLLNRFYDDYDSEIKKHFLYEEESVFPYVEGLLTGSPIGYTLCCISKFEENHTNVGEKLNDLKNIIIKYLPDNHTSNIKITVLNKIFSIEEDLKKHAMVENKLLIPLVAKIEKNNG